MLDIADQRTQRASKNDSGFTMYGWRLFGFMLTILGPHYITDEHEEEVRPGIRGHLNAYIPSLKTRCVIDGFLEQCSELGLHSPSACSSNYST
jgi:hypothetical protein